MKEKIIFFDLDGTLLDEEKKIVKSALEAVCLLREKGHIIAIATGRAPFMFQHINSVLNVDTYVSFNGQYVVCDKKVIYKNPLNKHDIENLEKTANEHQHSMVCLDENAMFSNRLDDEYIRKSIHSLKFDYPRYNPNFFYEKEVYQALLFCEETDDQKYFPTFEQFHFIRWHEYSLDVLPHGGSKANGITRIINELNMQREDVIAFGDGLNDLEMLQYAHIGVAMGNAKEQVKECADYVTDDAHKDGIYNAIKKLNLI